MRDELDRDFFRGEAFLKMIRVRAGERRDDVANAIELEENAEFAVARAAIVTDGENVACASAGERLDQIVGEACATEADRD